MSAPANPNRASQLTAILAEMPGNSTSTQRQRILTAMERLGSITTFEGTRLLDCYDPTARVHELRKAGCRIKTVMRAEETESGVLHRVGVYMLEAGAHG